MRTIVFTVHEPPQPRADRIERAEQLEFVRDGFVPLAGVIPPLWMVMNRLWRALLVYLLASAGLSLGLAMLGVDKSLIGLINLAANMVIGFEASSIQRWTLARHDWSEVGTVVGRTRAECERRFFDGWLDQQPVLQRSNSSGAAAVGQRATKLRLPGFGVGRGVAEATTTATSAVDDGGQAHDIAANDQSRHSARSLWKRLLGR